jgi:hypothetical protein
MGGTVAIIVTLTTTSGLVVSSGFIGLQKKYDLSFDVFFLGTAAVTVIGMIPILFCLKDVSGKKKKEEKRHSTEILKQAFSYLKKERSLLMGYLGSIISKSYFLMTGFYASNIYY